jgi:hypothetical protein
MICSSVSSSSSISKSSLPICDLCLFTADLLAFPTLSKNLLSLGDVYDSGRVNASPLRDEEDDGPEPLKFLEALLLFVRVSATDPKDTRDLYWDLRRDCASVIGDEKDGLGLEL